MVVKGITIPRGGLAAGALAAPAGVAAWFDDVPGWAPWEGGATAAGGSPGVSSARSVEDVGREAGVHRSVAFEHLERLVALGYLEVAHRRGLPGKPAKIYKLTGGPVQISHPMRRYDIVAESLGRAFDELGDVGSHAVRRAGRNFGESIASGGARSAMAALEPMLEMGAEYEMDRGGIIQCNNCLFAEVCRRAPVICRFHAGILDGLFMHTELNVSVQALGFRDPYGCAYMLQENTLGEELEAQAR